METIVTGLTNSDLSKKLSALSELQAAVHQCITTEALNNMIASMRIHGSDALLIDIMNRVNAEACTDWNIDLRDYADSSDEEEEEEDREEKESSVVPQLESITNDDLIRAQYIATSILVQLMQSVKDHTQLLHYFTDLHAASAIANMLQRLMKVGYLSLCDSLVSAVGIALDRNKDIAHALIDAKVDAVIIEVVQHVGIKFFADFNTEVQHILVLLKFACKPSFNNWQPLLQLVYEMGRLKHVDEKISSYLLQTYSQCINKHKQHMEIALDYLPVDLFRKTVLLDIRRSGAAKIVQKYASELVVQIIRSGQIEGAQNWRSNEVISELVQEPGDFEYVIRAVETSKVFGVKVDGLLLPTAEEAQNIISSSSTPLKVYLLRQMWTRSLSDARKSDSLAVGNGSTALTLLYDMDETLSELKTCWKQKRSSNPDISIPANLPALLKTNSE